MSASEIAAATHLVDPQAALILPAAVLQTEFDNGIGHCKLGAFGQVVSDVLAHQNEDRVAKGQTADQSVHIGAKRSGVTVVA